MPLRPLVLAALLLASGAGHAQPSLLILDDGRADGRFVVTTPAGLTYVAGTFGETVDFDPGPGSAVRTPISPRDDGFLAVYDGDGAFVRALTVGATGSSYAGVRFRQVAVDAEGAMWIVGSLHGTADFDPGPGVVLLQSAVQYAYQRAGFIAKYTSDGPLVFAFAFENSQAFSYDEVGGIVLDAEGHAYVTGGFDRSIDIDPGPGEVVIKNGPAHTTSGFVASYTAEGALRYGFALALGPNREEFDDWVSPIRLDPTGGLAVGGMRTGTADFDPGPEEVLLTGEGGFVARYTLDGAFRSVLPLPLLPRAFALDPDGYTYATGWLGHATDFDPGPDTLIVDAEVGTDAFVVRYTPDFTPVYAFAIGGRSNILITTDRGQHIEADDLGRAYVSGVFYQSADLDPGPDTLIVGDPEGPQTSSGSFLARYTSEGALDFGFSPRRVADLALNPDGQTFSVLGRFSGTVDFDPGPDTLLATGTDALYVVTYDREDVTPTATDPIPAPSATTLKVAPNPFVDGATLTFTPNHSGRVRIEAFSVLGRRVALLFDGEAEAGRTITATLDGARLAPGVYLVRVTSPDGVQTRRVTRLR